MDSNLDAANRRAIEADCERLIKVYARLLDAGDWDGLAAMYTEDARLARPSERERFIEGRSAIVAAFKARPARTARHVVSNIIVDVEDADTARAFSVILLFQGKAAKPGVLPPLAAGSPQVGGFADRLVRTKEGWRFRERAGWLDFS